MTVAPFADVQSRFTVTTAESATAQCFPRLPALPAGTPFSGTQSWLTENPHQGVEASGTEGYRRLLPGNLLDAQGNRDCLYDSGRRSRYRNMYSYVRNNPLAFIDPSGLCSQDSSGVYQDSDDGGTFLFSGACSGGQIGGTAPYTVNVNSSGPPSSGYDWSSYSDVSLDSGITFYANGYGAPSSGTSGANLPTITSGRPQTFQMTDEQHRCNNAAIIAAAAHGLGTALGVPGPEADPAGDVAGAIKDAAKNPVLRTAAVATALSVGRTFLTRAGAARAAVFVGETFVPGVALAATAYVGVHALIDATQYYQEHSRSCFQ